MRPTLQILGALAASFAAGLVISGSAHPALQAMPGLLEPLGVLFTNAIRMTVVPLVVSKLIVAVAMKSGDASIARLGVTALAICAALLVVAGSFSAVVSVQAFALLPLDDSIGRIMRESAGDATAADAPTFRQWFEALVPSNVVTAAADAAMLPLIVFAVVLGLALGRVSPMSRRYVVRFFEGVAEAMLVIVRGVLTVAPIGVFALTVPVVARLGTAAAEALVGYVAVVGIVTAVFAIAVLYPLGSIVGRVPLAVFAREVAPAQVIAFSARSSLASLPVMMAQGAKLGLPATIIEFFLPLAASMFRPGGVMGTTTGALFIAHLYGITLDVGQIATVVATAVLVASSSPGVPSGSILVIVPILGSIGLPAAGIGILLGVDALPDMFRTTTNITGDMAVACALGGRARHGTAAVGK